jgi:hypothetical protein
MPLPVPTCASNLTAQRRLARVTRGLERGLTVATPAAGFNPYLPGTPGGEALRPIAHWPLDEILPGVSPTGRPVVLDVAGGCHGTVVGAQPAFGARQLRRGALAFEAQRGDHISVPFSPVFELNSFTVCAWVRLSPRTAPTGRHDVLGGVLGTRFHGAGQKCCFDLKVNGGNRDDGLGPKVHR